MSHLINGKSTPLCSEWQRTHSWLDPGLMWYEACRPRAARRREAMSSWQSRHLNTARPPPSLWHAVDCVALSRELRSLGRGAGEICERAQAATELRKINARR